MRAPSGIIDWLPRREPRQQTRVECEQTLSEIHHFAEDPLGPTLDRYYDTLYNTIIIPASRNNKYNYYRLTQINTSL